MTGFLAAHNIDVSVLLERGAALIDAAQKAGADAADAVIVAGRSLAVSVLNGKIEEHENTEGDDFGLRVFIGKRQAIVSSNDTDPATFKTLAERAVAMAKAAPENPFAGLPDPDSLARFAPHLDLFDPTTVSGEKLVALAVEAESAALSVAGVTKSGGASASSYHGSFALLSSDGFSAAYASSLYSLSSAAIGGEGTAMERDYDYSAKRHFSELAKPADIGRSAGERTARRLNPKKMASGKQAVIFDNRVANSLIAHLAGAISGDAIARHSSFLKDSLGRRIFHTNITITDDPLRPRGYRSHPFDAEGVRTQKRNLVEHGILTTWLLDTTTARELGMVTTGHAERGVSSRPSPSSTNLILQPGAVSKIEMLKNVKNGLLVTDLIGRGVNLINGDYSRGCSGFLIENGELATPVSEITIAGNLNSMFAELAPANDLEIRSATAAPSCFVGEMMIAGR